MSEETKETTETAEEQPKRSRPKKNVYEKAVEAAEAKEEKKPIKATPIFENGWVEPPKAADIGDIDRSKILEGRYVKIELRKVIVTDQSGQNKDNFTCITPQKVKLDGYEGEYLDLKCTRYVETKGLCGEEIEVNQYVYNALRGSTRPVQKRVKQGDQGAYTDVCINARNWAIEQVGV